MGISGILSTCCGNHFRTFYPDGVNSREFIIPGVVTKFVFTFCTSPLHHAINRGVPNGRNHLQTSEITEALTDK